MYTGHWIIHMYILYVVSSLVQNTSSNVSKIFKPHKDPSQLTCMLCVLRHARLPSASHCSSDVSCFSPFQSITILPLLDLSRDFMARNPRTHSPGHHTSDSCLLRPVVPGIHPSLLPPFVFHPPPPFFIFFHICWMLTGNWHFNKLSRCLEIYESKFRSGFP